MPYHPKRLVPQSIMQEMYTTYRTEIKQSLNNLFDRKDITEESRKKYNVFTADVDDYMKSLDTRYFRGDDSGGIVGEIVPQTTFKNMWGKPIEGARAWYDDVHPKNREANLSFRPTIGVTENEGEFRWTPEDIEFQHGAPDTIQYSEDMFKFPSDVIDPSMLNTIIHEFLHGRPGRESDVYDTKSASTASKKPWLDKSLIDYKLSGLAKGDDPYKGFKGLTHDNFNQQDYSVAVQSAMGDIDYRDKERHKVLGELSDWKLVTDVLYANTDKQFIKRIFKPEMNIGREVSVPPVHGRKSRGLVTHSMKKEMVDLSGSGDIAWIAFPTVVDKGGEKLERLSKEDAVDYALENKEYIEFGSNEEDVNWFIQNYEKYWESEGVNTDK